MDKTTALSMLDFIQRSPSCYHAVANLAAMLEEAGFAPLAEHTRWPLEAGGSYYVVRNGASLLAFRIPEQLDDCGFMIGAAHGDSPTLKLKAIPELVHRDYLKLNVAKYGGINLSPWLDRPLSVAGRVTVLEEDGRVDTRLVNLDRDLVLIPNLSIHMNRQINDGVALNPQIDMLPLLGQGEEPGTIAALVGESLGVERDAILDTDLFLYLRESGRIWGAKEEFLSSPRLDDLECAWACTRALIETPRPRSIAVSVVFDNEEVGSRTKQGAASNFLQDTLDHIGFCLGRSVQQHRALLTSSLMVSADNSHALHPNHPEKSDELNFPRMNGGVVIKYSARQKYTTDAITAGLFKVLCRQAHVPVQVYHNRSDMSGGGTLGNISSAHVSIHTVDVGVAQLAMHSCYETAGVQDVRYLLDAMKAVYASRIVCEGLGTYRILPGNG